MRQGSGQGDDVQPHSCGRESGGAGTAVRDSLQAITTRPANGDEAGARHSWPVWSRGQGLGIGYRAKGPRAGARA